MGREWDRVTQRVELDDLLMALGLGSGPARRWAIIPHHRGGFLLSLRESQPWLRSWPMWLRPSQPSLRILPTWLQWSQPSLRVRPMWLRRSRMSRRRPPTTRRESQSGRQQSPTHRPEFLPHRRRLLLWENPSLQYNRARPVSVPCAPLFGESPSCAGRLHFLSPATRETDGRN